jgi:hypothetical protein
LCHVENEPQAIVVFAFCRKSTSFLFGGSSLGIFGWGTKAVRVETAEPGSDGNLRFISTKALELALDGSDESFKHYFFAIYGCGPDEESGIKSLRDQLRAQSPSMATDVGRHFVLAGSAAYHALSAFHVACINADTLPKEFREYLSERLAAITDRHNASQSLPVPIDLTEGQLSHDERLEFLTCIALSNGQVVPSTGP